MEQINRIKSSKITNEHEIKPSLAKVQEKLLIPTTSTCGKNNQTA
jgi:hypothetical protein